MSGLNIILWICQIVLSLYLYYLHTDGIMQFIGYALFITSICSQTPMIYMCVFGLITMGYFEAHEKRWEHLKPSDV